MSDVRCFEPVPGIWDISVGILAALAVSTVTVSRKPLAIKASIWKKNRQKVQSRFFSILF
jgi:hypothetical protein